jgi:hypothetical protein
MSFLEKKGGIPMPFLEIQFNGNGPRERRPRKSFPDFPRKSFF